MRTRAAAGAAAVLSAAVAGVLAGVLAAVFSAPAGWAHVEVSADNPQAGARNVTVTFEGEAESDSAGIVSQRVVLPAGIGVADVRLVKAPAGWTLTPGADGYTVAGRNLPVGANAVHSILIAQLPSNVTELVFKTVETYGDGKVSRWIEVPEAGKPEPENPAPVLKLRPAAAPATTAAPTPTTAMTPTGPATTSQPSPAPAAQADTGSMAGLWAALVAALAAAAVLGGLLAARWRHRAHR